MWDIHRMGEIWETRLKWIIFATLYLFHWKSVKGVENCQLNKIQREFIYLKIKRITLWNDELIYFQMSVALKNVDIY